MDRTGNTYPFIPYDLIIDTDVGLYMLIKEKYRDDNVFYLNTLDLDLPYLTYFLTNRQYANPLYDIAKDVELFKDMDEYYKQFFEQELDFILQHSIATALYDFLYRSRGDVNVHTTIWVPSEEVQDRLIKGDPETFKPLNYYVSPFIYDKVTDDNEPMYVKNVLDIREHFHAFDGKYTYAAEYPFNFVYDEVRKKNAIRDEVGDLLGMMMIRTYKPYRDQDMKVILE